MTGNSMPKINIVFNKNNKKSVPLKFTWYEDTFYFKKKDIKWRASGSTTD